MAAFIDEDMNIHFCIHVLKLYPWSCSLHKLPWASGVKKGSLSLSSLLSLQLLHAQVSLCYQSIFLSTHLRVSDFWLWSGLHRFPCCYFHFFSFIGIPRIDQIHQILWRVFLAPRAAWYQVDLSRFRRYHRLCFCHWWAFTWSRLLTSSWHGALLSDRIRKKITEMASREHRSQCWTNEEDVSVRHAKNFLWLACRRVGFWCQHIFLDLWF